MNILANNSATKSIFIVFYIKTYYFYTYSGQHKIRITTCFHTSISKLFTGYFSPCWKQLFILRYIIVQKYAGTFLLLTKYILIIKLRMNRTATTPAFIYHSYVHQNIFLLWIFYLFIYLNTECFILYMHSAGSCIFKFLINAQRSVIYPSFLIFLPHLYRYNIIIVGNSDHDWGIFSLPDLFLHSNIPVLSGWTSKGERACFERSARPLSGWCPKETLSSKRWWGYHSRKVHRGQREKE